MGTQATVKTILQSVIGIKEITAESRFLDLGGNSLNLVEVLSQIKQTTGVALSPRIFFDRDKSSVRSIAAEIDTQREIAK